MNCFIIEQKTGGITLRKMYIHNFIWSEDSSMVQFTSHLDELHSAQLLPLVFWGLIDFM